MTCDYLAECLAVQWRKSRGGTVTQIGGQPEFNVHAIDYRKDKSVSQVPRALPFQN